MNKALKGAVLSGLVLPGLGQIVLKCYIRGALLMLASLACLAVLIAEAVELAKAVIGKIDLLNAAIDPVALLAEVSRATATSSGWPVKAASWLLMFLWLGGAVDAYLLGRKLDLQERSGGW